jgi:uncharacterized protein (DUF433 family)
MPTRYNSAMKSLERITQDPQVMGGKPCIRGMRVTVGAVVGLVAAGHSVKEILAAYPYLEGEDITEALQYAAWRSQEREVTLTLSPDTVIVDCKFRSYRAPSLA